MAIISILRKNVPTKKLPGAKKPIKSHDFRDRYQVDLIDMRSDPQQDIYGVEMKWIVTCKDHSTGFTVVQAIPKKKAKYVARVLERLFSIIGYPKISHIDNGNEFTAQEIVQFLKSVKPNILSVTGRIRKPSDQGSAENVNKVVKKCNHTISDADRIDGKMPNWVRNLPRINQSINSMGGKDSNNTSPYEALFGVCYHDIVGGSLDDVRKCKTIEDCLKMYPDPTFQQTAESLCILRDDNDVEPPTSSNSDSYWDPSSNEEEDEDYNKKPAALLMDASGTNKPALDTKTQVLPSENTPVKPALDTKPPALPSANTPVQTITKILNKNEGNVSYKKTVGVNEAFASSKASLLTRGNKQYSFLFPRLECDCLLSIGDEDYLKACASTKMWWHSDFIAAFGTLVHHYNHKTGGGSTVQLMHAPYPNRRIKESELRALSPTVEVIAAVIHAAAHYAILEVLIQSRVMNVYDGLGYSTNTWLEHVYNVLTRARVLDCNRDECSFARKETTTWTLTTDGGKYAMDHSVPSIHSTAQ